jgi:hypothetical protein
MPKEDTVVLITNVSCNVVALNFSRSDAHSENSSVPPNEDGTMFFGPNSERAIEIGRIERIKLDELVDRGILKLCVMEEHEK